MELSQDTKNILGLQLPTDPRWVDLASISIEAILTDHAYCEQKAATTCITLIQKYSDRVELVEELSPIVTEEWGHFRAVLAELKKRNLPLGKQRKDIYVNKLLGFQKKDGSPEQRFLDRLLIMALIEARSCERFKVFAENMEDEELSKFYTNLMVSEANHYTVFLKFAREYQDREIVDQKWNALVAFEAEMMKERGNSAKIHG